jgi:ribosomal protein S18 acetylase RimI-like enzyme
MSDYEIRAANKGDEPFLWQMLYFASHMYEQEGALPESLRTDPDLFYYVAGWTERLGDLGVIAISSDGLPAGAAWVRVMPPKNLLSGYCEPDIPELAIATTPQHRGQGVGTLMLRDLLDAAYPQHPAIVLSVRANNPALRLYQSFGFATVSRVTNRVGTESVVMRIELGTRRNSPH